MIGVELVEFLEGPSDGYELTQAIIDAQTRAEVVEAAEALRREWTRFESERRYRTIEKIHVKS